MKEISIIIPIYNGEKFIKKCLDSILINDNKNYEVIIINDGSTDGTREILNNYKEENIKIINNNNNGVSFSRNLGIKLATGKYIMFVDIDDYLSSNWYEIIKEEIQKSDMEVGIFSKNDISCEKNIIIDYIIGYKKKCLGAPFSKIFSTKYIKENKIMFNERLINGEDMLFNIQAIYNTKRFKVFNKSFYNYKHTIGSATNRFDIKILENDKLFNEELSKILKEEKYNNILKYCLTTGLYTVINRITYLKEIYKCIECYKKINRKFYANIDINLVSFDKKIIIKLYNIRFYLIVCIFLKLKIYATKKIKGKNFFEKV